MSRVNNAVRSAPFVLVFSTANPCCQVQRREDNLESSGKWAEGSVIQLCWENWSWQVRYRMLEVWELGKERTAMHRCWGRCGKWRAEVKRKKMEKELLKMMLQDGI